MLKHKPYIYLNRGIEYSSIFREAKFTPHNLPVTAVLSVPILNNKVLLVKQSDTKWWDLPGGHIEKGENWNETISRELKEEAGVVTDHHQVIGYFEINAATSDKKKPKYPSPSIIPVTLCFVQKYIPEWEKPKDTLDRKIVSFKELNKYIGGRKDDGQISNILSYAKDKLDSMKVIYEFSFVKNNIDFNIPVTQVYGFCKDVSTGDFCIVRETGQYHYSLPGGSCEIGESPENAFRRELMEETLFKTETIVLVGATKVDTYTPDKKIHLQTLFQIRFYTEIKELVPFIPNKDGFEVEERIFVSFSDLLDKVEWLKTEVGLLVVEEIIKLK